MCTRSWRERWTITPESSQQTQGFHAPGLFDVSPGIGRAGRGRSRRDRLMSMDALSAHLVRLELFHGLKPLQITEVVRRAEKVVYKPGQTLIAYGDQGDAAIIIVAGEAVRTKAPMAPPDHEEPIEPGSILGEMAMLIETEYSSTVVARSPVRALRIPRTAMLEIM